MQNGVSYSFDAGLILLILGFLLGGILVAYIVGFFEGEIRDRKGEE